MEKGIFAVELVCDFFDCCPNEIGECEECFRATIKEGKDIKGWSIREYRGE